MLSHDAHVVTRERPRECEGIREGDVRRNKATDGGGGNKGNLCKGQAGCGMRGEGRGGGGVNIERLSRGRCELNERSLATRDFALSGIMY